MQYICFALSAGCGASVLMLSALTLCGAGLAMQRFVPAERPDADPFDKERMRRSMLIRRFLVFMRDINQNQYLSAKCHWPPVLASGSKPPLPYEEDWNKWKSKVLVPAYLVCSMKIHK